jgi:hypothetical protein
VNADKGCHDGVNLESETNLVCQTEEVMNANMANLIDDEKEVINKEIVDIIVAARETKLGKAENKRKPKEEQWGPMLVERQRRRQDKGVPIMQKAIELKKRKNLECDKGNPFSILQPDNLYQIVRDVNLKFGNNSQEASHIIEPLVTDDQSCYDNFVDHNPDIMMYVVLEFNSDQNMLPLKGVECDMIDDNLVASPEETFKVSAASPPWTEVVRRGKPRGEIQKIMLMRGAIWNIRCLNKAGRIKCLNDFIMNNKLDFVGIQETKKKLISLVIS